MVYLYFIAEINSIQCQVRASWQWEGTFNATRVHSKSYYHERILPMHTTTTWRVSKKNLVHCKHTHLMMLRCHNEDECRGKYQQWYKAWSTARMPSYMSSGRASILLQRLLLTGFLPSFLLQRVGQRIIKYCCVYGCIRFTC